MSPHSPHRQQVKCLQGRHSSALLTIGHKTDEAFPCGEEACFPSLESHIHSFLVSARESGDSLDEYFFPPPNSFQSFLLSRPASVRNSLTGGTVGHVSHCEHCRGCVAANQQGVLLCADPK